ncbi:zinc finger protein 395-like [Oncorhynchus masou masou]|uniref:zinc finger protein 395-like n=1 Tax=Oncorhynchus masou masou TaxID=90313 RepID=UPI0031836C24
MWQKAAKFKGAEYILKALFRSPGSVEMDEIMAAMVLTSMSCSPVVQSSPQGQNDPVPGKLVHHQGRRHGVWGRRHGVWGRRHGVWGGDLSDSGSSGYWSWDHDNVSPALSLSVIEMDSSPDEGLHTELEQGSSFRGAYRCLWPSCGKVLTSSVGMKRHVRVMHLGSGSEQSHREEDFYYTKFSCKAPPALVPALSSHVPWASCGSPPDPGPGPGSCLQIPSSPSSSPSGSGSSRPSSGPGSTPGSTPGSAPDQPSPLSQSAPSSFWQTDHPYQACTPLQVTVSCHNSAPCCWTPPPLTVSNQPSHHNSQVVRGRCRSVSVGEQWLQQNSATNRLTTMRAASPSRAQCSFRKGRGEAKKCRKVYGVEHKEQWCTACRWKKACQRFTD